MRDEAKIHLTARAVKRMTNEQWFALRQNVVADGRWENAPTLDAWMEWDTLMVAPEGGAILIGIEKDGHTHS